MMSYRTPDTQSNYTKPNSLTKLVIWFKSIEINYEKIFSAFAWIVGILFMIAAIIGILFLGYSFFHDLFNGTLMAPSTASRICEAANGIHDPRCIGYFARNN